MNQVAEIIERKIRPLLQEHQGDLELVEITADGYVKVRLTGACATCPGAQATLSEVIESQLRQACPEINGVVPVYQVNEDLINQALKILRKDRN